MILHSGLTVYWEQYDTLLCFYFRNLYPTCMDSVVVPSLAGLTAVIGMDGRGVWMERCRVTGGKSFCSNKSN